MRASRGERAVDLVDVDPDPADDGAVAAFEQDPRDLPALDEHVVRPLHAVPRARPRARRSRRPRARRRGTAAPRRRRPAGGARRRRGAPSPGSSSHGARAGRAPRRWWSAVATAPSGASPARRSCVVSHSASWSTAARAGRGAAARSARARGRSLVGRRRAVSLHRGAAALRFRAAARAMRRSAGWGDPPSLDVKGVASFATSRSTASSRFRAWLRSSCATARMTGRPSRGHGSSAGPSARATPRRRRRASTRVSDVFACWPPGPEERETRSSISSGRIETERVTRMASCSAMHASLWRRPGAPRPSGGRPGERRATGYAVAWPPWRARTAARPSAPASTAAAIAADRSDRGVRPVEAVEAGATTTTGAGAAAVDAPGAADGSVIGADRERRRRGHSSRRARAPPTPIGPARSSGRSAATADPAAASASAATAERCASLSGTWRSSLVGRMLRCPRACAPPRSTEGKPADRSLAVRRCYKQHMRYDILGPVEVVGDNGASSCRRAGRGRSLLLLLLRPNEPISLDALVEDLWNGIAAAERRQDRPGVHRPAPAGARERPDRDARPLVPHPDADG